MPLRILLLIAFSATLISAQVPVCADEVVSRNCCGVNRIEDCPLVGCGGDPELNKKKNRTDSPPAAAVELKTFTQLTKFKHPKKWTVGTGRVLLEQWGEGRAVQLVGFVFEVDDYKDGHESTNCHLATIGYNDFHITLVENLTLANKWKDRKAKIALADTPAKKKKAEDKAKAARLRVKARSLTAEITPRLRTDGWTIERLRSLERDFAYVRITGWAMLDTQHIKNPINRRSNWELHPVTNFEVCTATVAECDAGTLWTNLQDVP